MDIVADDDVKVSSLKVFILDQVILNFRLYNKKSLTNLICFTLDPVQL